MMQPAAVAVPLSSPVVVALLAALVAVELGLLAWALVDLSRRTAAEVNGGSRLLWLLLCVLLQLVGPVIYLLVGRVRPVPADEPTGVPASRVTVRPEVLLGEVRPAPHAAAVELGGVTKLFGRTAALDGLTLSVPAGSVFGFLGPNGAGKTTTLRILAGLAHADAGVVRILGRDVARGGADARSLIGFLPDVPAFYKWMTAPEYLRFAGSLFGLSGKELEDRVAAMLELAGLTGVRTRVGGYSRGMKQRLGVAQALIHDPLLLLLDEPTSALDPIGRRDVLDMVAALRGRTTVFFSTHILADVERVCDTVAVIARGKVVAQSGIDELRSRRGGLNRLSIEVDDPQRLSAGLSGAPWLRTVEAGESGELLVTCDDVEAAQRELPALVGRLGLALRRFGVDELDLEDVFVDLVGEGRR